MEAFIFESQEFRLDIASWPVNTYCRPINAATIRLSCALVVHAPRRSHVRCAVAILTQSKLAWAAGHRSKLKYF